MRDSMRGVGRTGISGLLVTLVAGTVAVACGGSAGGKGPSTAAGSVVPAAGGECRIASGTEPIGHTGSSATVALAKVHGKRVAFVADEDAKAILTVDLDSHKQLAETKLGARPGQLYVGKDGRIFVTLRDKNELVVLSASQADAPLARVCGATTSNEPIAIAVAPDDRHVAVTSGWGQRLALFDRTTLAARFEAKVGREPRAVVISDDGATAFVSHAVGAAVSTVDLADPSHEVKSIAMRGFLPNQRETRLRAKMGKKGARFFGPGVGEGAFESAMQKLEQGRPTCQGFALAKSSAVGGRIFAPQVIVDPGDLDQRPDGYGDQNSETEAPSVAVLDEGTRAPLLASTTLVENPFQRRIRGDDTRNVKPECLLPRAAALDPATKSLLVTCYGIDAVVAYDATAANPLSAERRRWTVGSGPSGVAIDTEKRMGVVWAQFDRSLSSFPIGGTELVDDKVAPLKVENVRLTALKDKLPPDYALGRILFHAAGDSRIASDGRACASCHPDGRDDGITWATPEGPRRSIMLAGRVGQTAPYSWNGNEPSLHGHLGNTFDRLSGKGLRSIELDALVAYVAAMPAPSADTIADKTKVERGRTIFASKEAGCAGCHGGAGFTDGISHDVGSKHKSDRAASFNTPSLHLVGGTGPYFHDGRYATLADLLVKSDGTMGHTKHLSNADLDALELFLRTL